MPKNKYFEELSNTVYEYLNLKKSGILIDDTLGLKIKTKGDVITVLNVYDEGIVCGLSFDQNKILSFMNKDGNDKLVMLDDNTNVEFNELELKIIFSVYKKVVLFLKPLIKINKMII